MFSIAIADDESAIRNGLERHIDWANMGFSVAGTFEDGRELIDYLERDSVDVVLTDIRMSSVSGLEVARYVRENHPATRVVIVSAHRDFDYAREAMQHGVKHYLLKPTLPEEIKETFGALRRELRSEETPAVAPIVAGVRKRREILLYELIAGAHASAREFTRRWEQSLLTHPRDAELISYLRFPVEDFDDGSLGRSRAQLEAGGVDVVLVTEASEYVHALVVRDTPESPPVTDIGRAVGGEDSKPAIVTRRPDQPIWIFVSSGGTGIDAERLAALRHAFHEANPDEQHLAVRRFFAQASADYPTVAGLRRLAVRCIRSLTDRPGARPAYASVFKAADRDAIETATIAALAAVTRLSSSPESLLVRLDRHVDARLAEDLSLPRVARLFHFSPTHFSRLVKRLSGITYGAYVRARRLQRARELLLETTHAIKDVAAAIGYSDSRYFNRQFRSETGMTPTEFRHSTRGSNER